jgi:cytochrome c-type biogenesis protein CcmE
VVPQGSRVRAQLLPTVYVGRGRRLHAKEWSHVNKRARTRLIGVTAIILIAVAAIFLAGGNKTAAYYKSVDEAATDAALVGERVKVGGAVVAGSWDRKSNPMTFAIRGEEDTDGEGPTVKVVYNGSVPSTFGDGVVAIVTGELADDKSITADEMITKCPSKYESVEGAMPLADLVGKGESMVGKTVKTAAFVKAGTIAAPGGGSRFIAAAQADGGEELPVAYEGALPEGMADGSEVIITGSLEADGTFVASDVALKK